VNILFISNVRFLRDALVTALQGAGENRAISACSHETIGAALVEFMPSLIVVDALHPEGTALVTTVRAQVPKASVIVLAICERDENFLAWADIGISGYLGPDISVDALLSAMRRVEAGEVACPQRLTALLLNRSAGCRSTGHTTRAGIFSLTTREWEVAELLADGMSNKLIARRLSCAQATVKNHVHSILDKWDCRSRDEAAARYRQQLRDDVKPSGGQVTKRRANHVSQIGGAMSHTRRPIY